MNGQFGEISGFLKRQIMFLTQRFLKQLTAMTGFAGMIFIGNFIRVHPVIPVNLISLR